MQRTTPFKGEIRDDDPSSFELVSGLRRYLPTIAIAAFVGVVAALFVSFAQSPRYTSTASVVIETADDTGSVSRVNMATEKQIASSTAVAGAVIADQHLDETPDVVLDELSVSVPVDTEVLVLSYTSTDPAQAQRLAHAFATAYLEYRRQASAESFDAANEAVQARIDALRADLVRLTTRAASELDPGRRAVLQASINSVLAQIGIQEQELASQATVPMFSGRQLAGASFPTSPSGPKVIVNAILGFFVGAVLGTVVALAGAFLGHMHTEEEVAHAVGAPVLAVIPRSRRADRRSPIIVNETSPAADAYRRLAVKLRTSQTGTHPGRGGGRTIAVVALDDRSDTATAVANLGAAISLSGRTVLLVSVTGQGIGLEATFNTPLSPGLGDVIRQDASLGEAIRTTRFPSLLVLPGGREDGRWAILDIEALRQAIKAMASTADVVIVHAPVRAAAETSALVAVCGELLLVGSPRAGSLDEARRTRIDLQSLGTPCIGIVVSEQRAAHRRRSRYEMPPDTDRTGVVSTTSVHHEPSSTDDPLSSPAGTVQQR